MARAANVREKIDRLREVRETISVLEQEEARLTTEVKEYMAERELVEAYGRSSLAKLGPVTTVVITPSSLVKAVGSLKKAEPMLRVLITECRAHLSGDLIKRIGREEKDVRLYVQPLKEIALRAVGRG